MAASLELRRRVLAAFKDLHLARLQTFRGDQRALVAGRAEINDNFRKKKDVSDPAEIEELITIAVDSARILRQHVVQLEEVGDKRFRANVTEDTFKIDNAEFREVTESELLGASKMRKRKCADTKDEAK